MADSKVASAAATTAESVEIKWDAAAAKVTKGTGDNNHTARSINSISRVIFEQQAAVMARLGVIYIDLAGGGQQVERSFGTYEAVGHVLSHSLAKEGLANGTPVRFKADIMWAADGHLETWFIVDSTSNTQAHLKLTGAAGSASFALVSVGPVQ